MARGDVVVFNVAMGKMLDKDALAYVDLGGPVDMTAGDLTVTWNGSGIFTIAKA